MESISLANKEYVTDPRCGGNNMTAKCKIFSLSLKTSLGFAKKKNTKKKL